MNSLQRYVLALSRVLVAIILLLNGLGIISHTGHIPAARRHADEARSHEIYPHL